MKIYIEFLIIFILIGIFLFWKVWFIWSKRRLNKKYKPENDKGRKGTEFRTNAKRNNWENGREREDPRAEELGTGKSTNDFNGLKQSERREFLQKTNVDDDGKNCNSIRKINNNDGKNSKVRRKIRFFRRRKP